MVWFLPKSLHLFSKQLILQKYYGKENNLINFQLVTNYAHNLKKLFVHIQNLQDTSTNSPKNS